jgi:hypothetical protein
MATLETQYKMYLEKNPDSKWTYDEWLKWHSEWLAESILGLFFNVGNNRKLINLHHDIIDYSKLDDYKKWAYEIE